MFLVQTMNAYREFPTNRTERFLVYPALAVYSSLEDLVRTAVGCAFTALSLVSLGLCPPINNVANWTGCSRRILTVPTQIIGNIFYLNSKNLMTYNLPDFPLAGLTNIVIRTFLEKKKISLDDLEDPNCPKPTVNEVAEIVKPRIENISVCEFENLTDKKLQKAKTICTNLFRAQTDSKIKALAKHLIFRSVLAINIPTSLAIGIIGVIPFSTVMALIALYKKGEDNKYNELALMTLKVPQIIHINCLALRMLINPFQFVDSLTPSATDDRPYYHALAAGSEFFYNPWN